MPKPPLVWVLHGAHAGDNAQASSLAAALGYPHETLALRYNLRHALPFWLRGAGLGSLDADSRQLIAPPWPELLIAVGKRSVPVARYIRQASGGSTRLVHIGRPRAPLAWFDLVITTPQYGLPPAPNVLELALPFANLQQVDTLQMAHWSSQWQSLPRPLVAVLVGAARFPQRFGHAEAVQLGTRLQAAAGQGTLLLIGSPRTRPQVLDALAAAAGPAALAYPFSADDNPYQAALALAERVVVTSDSMSMIADAILSPAAASIHQLPVSPLAVSWSSRSPLPRLLARGGLLSPPRDMRAVARRLIEDGYADALGTPTGAAVKLSPDYHEAVERIRSLLPQRPAVSRRSRATGFRLPVPSHRDIPAR